MQPSWRHVSLGEGSEVKTLSHVFHVCVSLCCIHSRLVCRPRHELSAVFAAMPFIMNSENKSLINCLGHGVCHSN